MKIAKLIATVDKNSCSWGGTCPSVYETDSGDIVIQGYIMDGEAKASLSLPQTEDAVLIPRSLLEKVIQLKSNS